MNRQPRLWRSLFLTILSGTVLHANAGTDSQWVLANTNATPVAISIRQNADVIVLPITLSCSTKDASQRLDQLTKALDTVKAKAKSTSKISLMSDPIARSPGSTAGLSALDFTETAPATISLYAVTQANRNNDDFYACAELLVDFAESVPSQGSLLIQPGQIQLAVDSPEQYREKILKAIMDEITRLKKLCGSQVILHISGLEGPVQVHQLNDIEVELFINYSLIAEVLEPVK